MLHYCRYCAFCISGDCYYCTCKGKVLYNVREVTTCKDFALSKFGDVDTGKMYKPRAKKAHKAEDDDNQLSFYKTEETQ